MSLKSLARPQKELEQIAGMLYKDIKKYNDPVVSRYLRSIVFYNEFVDGKKSTGSNATYNLNLEKLEQGTYSSFCPPVDISEKNYAHICACRDFEEHHPKFPYKKVPLPNDYEVHFEPIPEQIDSFDEQFKAFTKACPIGIVTTGVTVLQKVIVNSNGGVHIQSIPYATIDITIGYGAMAVKRTIDVVCNSSEDFERMPAMMKYWADPTPNRCIKNAKHLYDAGVNLAKIYGLKEDLEKQLSKSNRHDIIFLSGTHGHEFMHGLEEPLDYLFNSESAPYTYKSNFGKKINILDDPNMLIEGFRPFGSTYFDAYGRKRKTQVLVRNGIVRGSLASEYAHNEKFKGYYGIEKSMFIGNAAQPANGLFQIRE